MSSKWIVDQDLTELVDFVKQVSNIYLDPNSHAINFAILNQITRSANSIIENNGIYKEQIEKKKERKHFFAFKEDDLHQHNFIISARDGEGLMRSVLRKFKYNVVEIDQKLANQYSNNKISTIESIKETYNIE